MCPIGFLMLGNTLLCSRIPTDERSSRAPGLSWLATRSSCHCPTTSHDHGRVQTDASAGPAPPAPASSARLPTQADHEPGMDAAGDHLDPDHPSRTAACPLPHSRTSLRPDTADAATHRHRTPDGGHRTADTWRLRRPHRTLDTGPVDRQAWTLDARTGHRTLAEDADRVTKARPTSGPPGPPRRATARWTPYRVPVDGVCGVRQPMPARR